MSRVFGITEQVLSGLVLSFVKPARSLRRSAPRNDSCCHCERSEAISLKSSQLLRRFLHPRRERLRAGPGVLGDVEQDALGAVELDLEAADPLRVGLIHVVRAAEGLDLLGGLVDILD